MTQRTERAAPIQSLLLGLPMTKQTSIELPVSAFTHRVFSHRYGGSHIEASHRSNKELWELLQIHPVQQHPATEQRLTHLLIVQVSGALAVELRRRSLPALGMALHGHCIREMYRFAEAQVEGGTEAWTSLRSYYDRHGIEEDDWSFDTTYRNWLRYLQSRGIALREKKHENPSKVVDAKRSVLVHKRVHQLAARFEADPISPAEVEAIVHRLIKSPRQKSPLLAWLLRHASQLSAGQTARRLRCTRPNVFRRTRTMQLAITQGKPLAHTLARILEGMRHEG